MQVSQRHPLISTSGVKARSEQETVTPPVLASPSIPAALRGEDGHMDLMGDFFHMPLKSRLFCYFKKLFLRIGCSVASFLLALRENVLY